MSKKLNKLFHNECFLIDILFNQERKSISEIAKILQRSKSTVSYELKRNTFDGYYNHKTAQAKTIERRGIIIQCIYQNTKNTPRNY